MPGVVAVVVAAVAAVARWPGGITMGGEPGRWQGDGDPWSWAGRLEGRQTCPSCSPCLAFCTGRRCLEWPRQKNNESAKKAGEIKTYGTSFYVDNCLVSNGSRRA